jgi:hypothetical protein
MSHLIMAASEEDTIEERSLEKRAGRIYSSSAIGSYGVSFKNFQVGTYFCQDNVFVWHALKYPSTSSLNRIPATGGEENTDDGEVDDSAVTSQSAPDIIGIGTFDAGPYIDLQYEYRFNSPDDPPGTPLVSICGVHIAGYSNRFASTNDNSFLLATGKGAKVRSYDSKPVLFRCDKTCL